MQVQVHRTDYVENFFFLLHCNLMNKRQLESPESEVAQADKIRKMANTEIKEMLTSFQNEFKSDCMAVITETNEEVKNIGRNLATLLERIEKNEQEITALKAEVSELRAENNYRDQKDIVNQFRISGLPPIKGKVTRENATKLALKVMQKIKVTCTEQDFNFCAMRSYETGATIVGEFSSSKKREEAIKAFRAMAKTTAITWNRFAPVPEGDPTGVRKIFLTSNLTKWTMTLLNKTREHQGTIFQYVWESNCRILVRKAAGQPVIEIKSPQQLQRIIDQN